MNIKRIIGAWSLATLLLTTMVSAGSDPAPVDATGSLDTKDELQVLSQKVSQSLTAVKFDLSATKAETRDSDNLTVRSYITTAEVIYNECVNLLADADDRINRNQLTGVNLQLSSISSKLYKARSMLRDARNLHISIKITSALASTADRFERLLKQARDAASKADNAIINKLIENALKEKDKAVRELKLMHGNRATEHYRFAENLLKKAIDLAYKDITAAELINRELEKLQNLIRKAQAAAAANETAANLVRQATELKTQIKSALQENRYAIALKLANKAEELLQKAIGLADRDIDDDSAADVIERYTALLNTVRDLRKNAGTSPAAAKADKLIENAREFADMGEKSAAAGKPDLSADNYRKAVKLLLRAKDFLGSTAAGSPTETARRKLAELKTFLARADATAGRSGTEAALNLLQKARTLYDRAAAGIKAGTAENAVKQIQTARRIAVKALELIRESGTRPGTADRLTAELDKITGLVKKAVRVTAENSDAGAARLAARAEEMLALSRKAIKDANTELASGHLLTAARLARKALQGTGTGTAAGSTAATLDADKALYRQLLEAVKPLTGTSEQAALLVRESENLMRSADAMETNGNTEGARITIRSATSLLTKARSIAQSQGAGRANHDATIAQIKSLLNKAMQSDAAQSDKNIKILTGLSAGYLAKAREAIALGQDGIALRQLTVARQMALKALQLTASGSTGAAADASRINTELEKLDDKLNQAKSRLCK